MGKSKKSSQDDQSSQQKNRSGVGFQFQPNQGLGSIEDTKQGKKQAKRPEEETRENEAKKDGGSFDDAEGEGTEPAENK